MKAKNKFSISYDDITFLLQELQKSWNSFQIPSFHQEMFKSHLQFLSPTQIPFTIAKEINQIESTAAPIQQTLTKITKREYLIGRLELFKEKTRHSNKKCLEIIELEAAYSLVNMRDVTVAVIKGINKWKSQLFTLNCEFYWNELLYMEKIKHDLDFLKELGRFHFVMRDPFFLSMDYTKVCGKAKNLIKVTSAQEKQFKKLEKKFNYGLPEVKSIKLTQAKAVDKELEDIFEMKVMTRQEMEQQERENFYIAERVFLWVFDEWVLSEVKGLVEKKKVKKEVKNMAERVFEGIINEFAENESREYIFGLAKEHSEVIYEQVLKRFIDKFTQELVDQNSFLAHNIACELCDCVNYGVLVKPCVSEVIHENCDISEKVCEKVIGELLMQPWVLTEVHKWVNIQQTKQFFREYSVRELKNSHFEEFSTLGENLVEEIYLKLIREYPGKKWLESIIKYSFEEVRGEDEPDYKTLLPI